MAKTETTAVTKPVRKPEPIKPRSSKTDVVDERDILELSNLGLVANASCEDAEDRGKYDGSNVGFLGYGSAGQTSDPATLQAGKSMQTQPSAQLK